MAKDIFKKGANFIDVCIEHAASGDPGVPKGYFNKLTSARKFVLDDAMSAHLADLTCAPFLAAMNRNRNGEFDPLFAYQVADGARRVARVPFPITWIEYNCIMRRRRTIAEYKGQVGTISSGAITEDENEIIPRVGWLIEQHPIVPTTYRMTEFCLLAGNVPVAHPFSYTWTSDDNSPLAWPTDLPFNPKGARPSEIATGLLQFHSENVGLAWADFMKEKFHGKKGSEIIASLMKETTGELRAVWCLLATLNDLPTTFEDVRPQKGHILRGNYKRFMDHRVVRLNVPSKIKLRTLAIRSLISARRKAHEVRGHWRNDWRFPRTPGCEHDWQNLSPTKLTCAHCGGRRIHVDAHVRGDTSLGFVTHDYSVQRKAVA